MKLKQRYNERRIQKLIDIGIKLGLIEQYPKELMQRLSQHFYCGNPVSVLLTNNFNLKKCHDRAYALTMGFDECKYITGWLPRLGKVNNDPYDPHFQHSWVEDENYVYDTTFVARFNKRFYRFIFGAKADKVTTSEELNQNEVYQIMKRTTKEDIENHEGIEAQNAFILMEILKLKEKATGNNLDYLKCQVPEIDMVEFARRQEEKSKSYIHNDRIV